MDDRGIIGLVLLLWGCDEPTPQRFRHSFAVLICGVILLTLFLVGRIVANLIGAWWLGRREARPVKAVKS
jgi:hypothetical protein